MAPTPAAVCRVCCLPARAERDELAGTMLVQLLQQQGFEAESAPTQWVPESFAQAGQRFAVATGFNGDLSQPVADDDVYSQGVSRALT